MSAKRAEASQTNARLIEAFLEMMAVERAAAANTLKNYGRDLERFSVFITHRHETLETAGANDISGKIRTKKRAQEYALINAAS